MSQIRFCLAVVACGIGLAGATGCAVPQPRGEGLYRRIQEPTTGAWYHLYLPVDYVRNNGRHPNPKIERWPLVMSFHGMKPYDNALPQEREWEKEADNYGYIVCAPELKTSDSFMQYPLTKEHAYVLEDKRNVIAIMEHVFATTFADRKRVLATSWSCGGYLAHYFPNRFPDRFACIATRLSNFSDRLMLEETTPLYRDRVAVALFIGDGDFPACKVESENAVAWYRARRFRVVRGKMIDNMGHQRIPQTAAAFFAEQLGIEPLRPLEAAKSLAVVRMTDYDPPQGLIAKMAPRTLVPDLSAATVAKAPMPSPGGRSEAGSSPTRVVAFEPTTAGRNYPLDRPPTYDPTPRQDQRAAANPSVPPTGAGATRVASRFGQQGANWLEPTASPSERGASAPPPGGGQASAAVPGGAPSSTMPPGRDAELAAGRNGQTPSAGPVRPTAPTLGEVGETAAKTNSAADPRRLDPQDGGQRPAVATADPANPPKPRPAGTTAGGSATGTNTSGERRSPAGTSQTVAQASTARRATVRLSGPAVGSAPHYVAFSVELPRSVLEGADCLWMDNGVWIGDEPRGVKILETPGQHRITILVVGKDNVEYRGSATVYVLDRGPVTTGS